jgi:hypothetical protein
MVIATSLTRRRCDTINISYFQFQASTLLVFNLTPLIYPSLCHVLEVLSIAASILFVINLPCQIYLIFPVYIFSYLLVFYYSQWYIYFIIMERAGWKSHLDLLSFTYQNNVVTSSISRFPEVLIWVSYMCVYSSWVRLRMCLYCVS